MGVVKTAGPDRADAEAAGLRWLAAAEPAGGTAVARVLVASPERLELERVETGPPSARAAARFGRSLAVTHAAGGTWFGCPPDDWPAGPAVGRSRQPLVLDGAEAPTSWGEWYARDRVAVFARRAADAGLLAGRDLAVLDAVAARLVAGDWDVPQPRLVVEAGHEVARVHGDLWSGNVLWARAGGAPGTVGAEPAAWGARTGVVLIDPLAHGGHAESDLGMLALFGLPHLDVVLDAYAESSALADGWRERLALHTLSPLLFHTVLFGGGYAREAVGVARRFA